MAQEGLISISSSRPVAEIDLPLKILVWQDDAAGTARLTDPAWLARRHGIDPHSQPAVAAMAALLGTLASAAAAG